MMPPVDPTAALRRAFEAAERSDHAEARREARCALEASAGAPEIVLLAARLFHRIHDHGEALGLLDAAAATGTVAERVAAYDLKRDLCGRLGWYREALAAAARALALLPSAARHERAAHLAFTAQSPLVGLAHLRAAIALDPASAELRMRAAARTSRAGRAPETCKLVESAVKLARGAPELCLRAAEILLSVGAFERAEGLLRLSLGPGAPSLDDEGRATALARLGELRLWHGEVDEALRRAEAALALDPSSALALRVRGAARVLRAAHVEALPVLDEAVRRDPRDAEALLWRAEAKLGLGLSEEALADAQAGGELAWDSTDYIAAQALISVARRRLGTDEGWPRFGLPDAVRAVCPDDPGNLALTLARMRGNRSMTATYVPHDDPEGRPRRLEVRPNPRSPSKCAVFLVPTSGPAAALRAFEAIHADYPDSPEPYCYHGEVHLYMGDYLEARANFERALALYARTRWAYIGLGATELLLERDPRRALETFRRGVEICGGTGPTLYAYRGEARRMAGDLAEARDDLAHAVQQQPRRVGAWVNLALVSGERGERGAQIEIVGRLAREAPGLVADAARERGFALWDAPLDALAPDAVRALLERMLEMLRGNRSSTCITYVTEAGELRSVPPTSSSLPRHDEEDRRILRERLGVIA